MYTSHSGWLEKPLIIANVLRHEWKIMPPYENSYCHDARSAIAQQEILAAYPGLDEQSIAALLRIHQYSQLPKILGNMQIYFFTRGIKL